ncbi:FMN-binding glutamate synthase family protein [Pontibacillus litoralis]|uniref:Glutamate synthase n=1 Tax=Pontibacillus litoralis JSM 072002 TaxID=1385512 RepID=A0A0A5G561_9BACI|nr:FMN-binding glutamate synthase family protein [Pontibacillus litoralis]KGX87184.1 glutamate synthase [Pontibacillus litoralis JSM 072002]
MATIMLSVIFAMVSVFMLCLLVIVFFWRPLMRRIVKQVGHIILTDSYQENIMELLPGVRHMGVQNILENSLRSETGDVLHRPLGSAKQKWPHFESLTFIPAQTSPFPVDSEEQVDVSVTIGPNAKKPLKISIPIMISGMAYGVALSEEVRMALTTASKKVDTAINSGEGGILPEELEQAGKYILQFSKTPWAKEEETIKRADMIEIKCGQGALTAMGTKISPNNLTGRAREVFGLEEGEDAIIYEHFFDNQTLDDMKQLVDELRSLSGGVPIGVKIGAGGNLEQDLDHFIQMGVDFITIDGGQAATHSAPPILSDDFGIPTLHAIVRATNYLTQQGKKEQISLIAAGGLMTPGDFLKAIALGADAVYVGSAILFTVAHGQVLNALPFEPPTQIVWNDGKFKDQFDTNEGADSAEKFLLACTEEMKMGLRAMGKRSLSELSRKDIVSYDQTTAKMIGIPFTFEPREKEEQSSTEKG